MTDSTTNESADRPSSPSSESGASESGASDAERKPAKKVEERTSSAQRTVRLGDRTLAYTATAGTLVLLDEDDGARASFFVVSYTLDAADPARRPVTFAFNGGPGSSSLWLQLGTFGPRRVVFPDAVTPPPPPYDVIDNEHSLLDRTDLVFIDPIHTGYSKPEGKAKASEFLGVTEDIASISELIRLWTTRHARWASPKLLAGESYGTLRAAGLLEQLQRNGMVVNGALLISPILDFSTILFEPSNDLPAIVHLPTYAATAYYHDALPERPAALLAFLEEVRAFAQNEYAAALFKGSRLSEPEATDIATRLHRYTGLSVEYLRRTRLRIEISRFCKELLRARGETVGRLDGRFLGRDSDDVGEQPEHDPSFTAVMGPYTAAMQDYLRRELSFENDRPYRVLNFEANESWQWSVKGRLGAPSTSDALRKAMTQNPHLAVFVANGLYDLATPFFATEYSLDHLALRPADRDRVTVTYYEAGHMMYLHPPSLVRLKADLASFFDRIERW
jgi:carboxypeptidase C (cathepsin A)